MSDCIEQINDVRTHGKLPNSPFADKRSVPPEHTFEIGLVLGGTVSAGAYTAGVLDFLVEALDAWERVRGKEGVPSHRAVLDVASGTSGGAICALILAKALSLRFAPWRPGAHESNRLNPFYRSWVPSPDGRRMLESDDLASSSSRLGSLLSADVLRDIARDIVAQNPTPGEPPVVRPYVASPFPLFMTLTNLRGVPFKQSLNGATDRGEYFVQHADYVSLSIDIAGNGDAPAKDARIRPDALRVSRSYDPLNWQTSWEEAAKFSLASAAFPFGLPLIQLARPMEHYEWRWVRSEDKDGQSLVVPLAPRWDRMIAGGKYCGQTYEFQAADGGVMNNLPIELTRTWLAGLLSHNDRSACTAKRAVVLVDPFSDEVDCSKFKPVDFGGLPGRLLRALIENNRFATADQSNFVDKETYSRFLITPTRDEPEFKEGRYRAKKVSGGKALATAGFQAFVGFFCEAFREHDFQLGRLNCQKFLSNWFLLDQDNSLFHKSEVNSGAVVAPEPAKSRMRRIVYLTPELDPLCQHNPHPISYAERYSWPFPEWPRGILKLGLLRDAVRARSDLVTGRARAAMGIGPGFGRLAFDNLIKAGLDDKITSAVIDAIYDDLRAWDLF